jgi:hypothetical protein
MSERWLIPGKVLVRPHEDGSFDELRLYMDGRCVLHMETMNEKQLWIGVYPDEPAEGVDCVHVNIGAETWLTIDADKA